jgi:steroid delta-isomerase-like uncharacterized protein
MASRNADTVRSIFEAFNRRDFDAALHAAADGVVWQDRATGATFKGHNGFREFMQQWVSAFSNAECVQLELIDAGDTVVAEFIGRGVNDGPLGPLPPSGKQMNHAFLEVLRFDREGQVVSGSLYYDQLSMMAQLGHGQPVEAVTR